MAVVDTIREEQTLTARTDQPMRANALSWEQAFTFWKGRAALYAVLKALQIGEGDTVLVPGYTCFAVPSAVMFTGAKPAFVDIDRHTFNISLQAIRETYQLCASRVKAVIVQHTYGIAADIRPILNWAYQNGVAVIEDCAPSWGSRYRDGCEWKPLGSFGDAAIFSSQWTKPASTGLGGWAIANDRTLRTRLRQFRQDECVAPSAGGTALLAAQVCARELASWPAFYWTSKRLYQFLYTRGLLVGTSSPEEFQAKMPKGYAKRMSSFQEWLLKRRLDHVEILDQRRSLRAKYDAMLAGSGFSTLKTPENSDPVLLRYPLRVQNKNRVMGEARRRGIELGDWYNHPIDVPEPSMAERFGYREGVCPEGERAAKEVINLPMQANVTEKQILRIAKLLKEVA